MQISFETGHRSDVGLKRKRNEDAELSMPENGVWVVADGMGGHAAGEVASWAVIRALASIGPAAGIDDLLARVRDRLGQANAAIRDHAAAHGLGTIGATVVALLIREDGARAVWSGDSRLYRLRGGRLELLTRDHSEVAALVETGTLRPEEAARHPRRNVITRAIGVAETVELEVRSFDAAPGDVWLLCSDGLTEHLADAEIRHFLGSGLPQAACDAMVGTVLRRGARDNVTVIAVAAAPVAGDARADGQAVTNGILHDV